MRKLQTITPNGSGHRLYVGAMLVALAVGVGLGVAGPAAAGNVLFSWKTDLCGNDAPVPICGAANQTHIPTVGGPTLVTTPTTMGGADFTVPTKIFSVMSEATFTYLPVYPYIHRVASRYNKAGSLMAGNWTPSAVKTFIDKDTQYPFITATPAPGRIVANVGPQGMAGPLPFFQSSLYAFTFLTPGVNIATAKIQGTIGGPLSSNPIGGGASFGSNVTNMTNMGLIVFAEPNIWAFTGTITVDQPGPFASVYFVLTAMDDRTASGGGQIQVVSAALSHNYTVTPLPAPLDGTATVTGYSNANAFARRSVFTFLPVPEPGQMAMLGMGVLGLASIGMRMRRR